MRLALVILVLAVCSARAAAASSAHCDSTPFTLGKPAMPKVDQAKPKPRAVQAVSRKPQPAPEGKQRLLASCKAGKAKKKSG